MRKNKVRRKTRATSKARHKKHRRNPTVACSSCGAGNKDNRTTCWKCGHEFVSKGKPLFGRSLRTKVRKAAKAKAKKKAKRRAKR